MSDDIRREDVIVAISGIAGCARLTAETSQHRGDLTAMLAEERERSALRVLDAIRALPPSPRAAAAQRLARAAQATGGDFAHLCDNPNWPVAESPCPCPWCEMDRALAAWQEAENP